MQVARFTTLLEKPISIHQQNDIVDLEHVLDTYPYFQAARGMHLMGLKNTNSFQYNAALKKHAAYTSDRSWLFEIITQEAFEKGPQQHHDHTTTAAQEQNVQAQEQNAHAQDQNAQVQEENAQADEKNVQQKETPQSILELGKPLAFHKNDRHSFEEWLQLSTKNTAALSNENLEDQNEGGVEKNENIISEGEKGVHESKEQAKTNHKEAKMAQINAFIAKNPKIEPQKKTTETTSIKDALKINKEALMTETLARVYLEQKKYKKALQAYKILSLKYPEKNSFFASQIKVIQKLIKDNQ